MYTSDIDANSKSALKTALVYLLASLFCVLFGAVYELFGHGVYSYFMIYAFVFPLAGGTLPFFLLGLARVKKYPRASARRLYHSGIAALTVGSVIRGVLDIYGTANSLTAVYWAAGGVFIVSGAAVYLIQSFGRGFLSRRRD